MTRTQKKRLIIAGIVVAIPVVFLVEEHFRGKRALGKLKQQLVAKGEKLAVNECRPPTLESAAENGFPELVRAASMLGGSSLTFGAPRSLRAVAPGRVEVIHSLTEWKVSRSGQKSATTNNWRTLEESCAGWSAPLVDVRAAVRRPAFDANVDYARGFDAQLPLNHFVRLKSAAQHLGLDALIQLHHGRLEEAIDDIEAQLLLSHQMRNERLLVSQLFRIAIAGNAIGPTWQALQSPGLTDAQLARVQSAWETNEFVVSMNQSLEMERAIGVAMYVRMRGSVDDAAKIMDAIGSWGLFGTTGASSTAQSFDEWVEHLSEGGGRVLTRGLYLPVWQFAWSHQDEKSYLEAMQEVLDGSREAARRYSVAPVSKVSKQLEAHWQNQSSYSRMSRHVSELLADSLARFPARVISFEAQRTLTVTAIALKRYERQHGIAPVSLAVLVPEFLREIPRDIFDGQPLRYRPGEGGSYLLYSIGKDERDDGGDATPPSKGSRNFHWINGRDWVWPMPATEEDVRAAEEKENQKK